MRKARLIVGILTEISVKKLGLGFGFATSQEYSWDFAYELTHCTTGYVPYQYYLDEVNAVAEASLSQWRNKFVITMKMRL